MRWPLVLVCALLVGCVDDGPGFCDSTVVEVHRVEPARYDASGPLPGLSGSSEGAVVFTDDMGQMVYSFTVNGRRYKARYSMSATSIKRHHER